MGQVETLADIQRQFNALFATTVAYKPSTTSWRNAPSPIDARGAVSDSPALGGGGVAAQGRWAAGRVRAHSHPGRMLVRGQGDASRAVSGTIQQAEPGGGGTARDDELARRIGRAGHAHGGYGIGACASAFTRGGCVGTCFWPTVATSRRSIWPTSPERADSSWCVRACPSIRWCEQRMTVEERSSWSCAASAEGVCAFEGRDGGSGCRMGDRGTGISSACGGEMEPRGEAVHVAGDESFARPVHGAGGG